MADCSIYLILHVIRARLKKAIIESPVSPCRAGNRLIDTHDASTLTPHNPSTSTLAGMKAPATCKKSNHVLTFNLFWAESALPSHDGVPSSISDVRLLLIFFGPGTDMSKQIVLVRLLLLILAVLWLLNTRWVKIHQ